ncbi:keratin-associated protein 5-1-like [Dermochelys coriacea]|uniref:keratin-associated protein 5-1-like n=1 Tax=Dermochelys coriacea TaxID=27794 RepID=UPI0018E710F4|nr:keratin-associated protein 5-1-like [Dermochelys coriacea]
MIYSSGRESYFNRNSTWYDPAGSWLDTRRTPFTYAYSTCCSSGCGPRGGHDNRCYEYRRSGCAENCHGSSGSCHGSGGHCCVRRPSYFHGPSGRCHGHGWSVCSERSCHSSGSSCHGSGSSCHDTSGACHSAPIYVKPKQHVQQCCPPVQKCCPPVQQCCPPVKKCCPPVQKC